MSETTATATVFGLHNTTMTLEDYKRLAADVQNPQHAGWAVAARPREVVDDHLPTLGPDMAIVENGNDGLPEMRGPVGSTHLDGWGTSALHAIIFATREPQPEIPRWRRPFTPKQEAIVRITAIAVGETAGYPGDFEWSSENRD